MAQQYLYQPDPGMLQQYYATVMPQAVVQPSPVSQEQLESYNQKPIPVAVPVSDIQNYTSQQPMPQQQFVQQAQQQRTLQPDRDRMAYYKLVQDRFNEIVNYAGGIENVAKAKNIELAQRKAADDVAAYYGPPPKIQEAPQDPRVIEIDGNKIATGGDLRSPLVLPTEMEKQAQQLAVKKAEAELAQAEQKSKLETGKAQQESAGSLTGLAQSVRIFDQASKLAKSMRSSPVLAQAVGGGNLLSAGMKAFDRSVAGTPQYDFAANANRLKSAAFAQAITMLKGMGALSNAEGQAITNSLTDVDNLKQSPEQYQKRLDEFAGLMDALIASKQKEMASIQGQPEKAPSINLETFDLGAIPLDNAVEPASPSAATPQPTQEGVTRLIWNGSELK